MPKAGKFFASVAYLWLRIFPISGGYVAGGFADLGHWFSMHWVVSSDLNCLLKKIEKFMFGFEAASLKSLLLGRSA